MALLVVQEDFLMLISNHIFFQSLSPKDLSFGWLSLNVYLIMTSFDALYSLETHIWTNEQIKNRIEILINRCMMSSLYERKRQ